MHVTIVGSLPYPPNSGGRIRTLSLAVRLARRHEVGFLFQADPDRDPVEEAEAYLRDHRIEPLMVTRAAPPTAGPAFYARLAANLASPLPYSVASHSGPHLRRAVDDLAERRRVDLWQLEGARFLEAMRGQPTARTLVMAIDVESLIWERYHATERDPLKRWYIKQQWRKFERFERAAFNGASRVVAVSPEDAGLVRGRFGMPRVDVVDNGIDRSAFEAVVPAPEPGTILFLGSLDWRPNRDAVELLLGRIFPTVRAAEPSAKLLLVGRNPPGPLAQSALATPGVELHADVPDVRPFLARSAVMAVPLRVGGGSRLKILEALAAGLPVVSTRIGAEGLVLEPGRHLEVVDGVEPMAEALLASLRDPARSRAQAEEGRRFVLGRYDWDTLADELERTWERCLDASASRPVPAGTGGTS